MPLILNIETGTDVCSVALSRGGRLISLRESTIGKQHAQNLGLYIDDIFKEMDVSPRELSAVAVGMGPGSYTGLRIGVSMAKGLCYALEKPMIAISSLKSTAAVALEDFEAGIIDAENLATATLCPMIDARRMEVYAQLFDSNLNEISNVEVVVVEPNSFENHPQRGEFFIFGSGAEKCSEIINRPGLKYIEVTPSARGMVQLSHDAFDEQHFVDVAYFEPFYLKDFVVTASKKKFF